MRRNFWNESVVTGLLAGLLVAATPVAGSADGKTRPIPLPEPPARSDSQREAELIVVPQVGILSTASAKGEPDPKATLSKVEARINIAEGQERDSKPASIKANTSLNLSLQQAGKRALQCQVVVPVPTGAGKSSGLWKAANENKKRRESPNEVVGNFTNGDVVVGARLELLKESAFRKSGSRIFRRSAAAPTNRLAMLEFFGYDLLKSPAVSLSPGSSQPLAVSYDQNLTAEGDRVDYVLPRSELLSYRVPWTIAAKIQSPRRIATVYSPSHPISWKRNEKTGAVDVSVPGDATAAPGPFRMSWLYDTAGVNGSAIAYPADGERDGYFLLLLAVSESVPKDKAQKREVTVVLDRSASTKGKRLTELRSVANGVLDGLRPGEKFNIMTYNSNVDAYSAAPIGNTIQSVNSAKTYLSRVESRGGSNIHDALQTCLVQPASPNLLPIVLFFTDGFPTAGKTTDENGIGRLVNTANPADRRIYTFGVGVEVNTPLLQRIANDTRGAATFVLPDDDLSKKVGDVVRALKYPVLTNPKLSVDGSIATGEVARVSQLIPGKLPDLYAGQQLVVAGRFRGEKPIRLKLSGTYLGSERSFEFVLDPKRASTKHRHVPRLWAGRRIAELVDAIRQTGAHQKPVYAAPEQSLDPRVAKWSKEVLQLTAEHGIITEYTAFLTTAPNRWAIQQRDVYGQVLSNMEGRAVRTRGGYGSVNQEFNGSNLKGQDRLNPWNWYYSPQMTPVRTDAVQQIGNNAFFRQGDVWVDGRLLNRSKPPAAKQTVRFGTPAYQALLKQLSETGDQGALGLDGSVLMLNQKQPVLVVPQPETARPAATAEKPVKKPVSRP